jgi:hypothetical protein
MAHQFATLTSGTPARRTLRGLTALAVIMVTGIAAPLSARADTFVESYLAPGVTTASSAAVCGGQTGCYLGTETFNELTPGSKSGTSYTTDFGSSGAVTATFTGNYSIAKADQYGGAGNTGNYAVTFDHSTGYTLSLATAAGTGVNYFGMDLTALDAGNDVSFYNNNTLVATYTPSQMIAALGSCSSGTNAYCGNPVTKQDSGEQFAFVNFYDQTGTFNKVVFTEGTNFGGGYEVDNMTVAYRATNLTVQGTVVPAPLPHLGATPIGAGILGVAAFFRRKKLARVLAAA